MREIKFRAWDKDRKIMINDLSSRVHDTTYELIQSSDDGNFFCGNYMENGDWQEPILMQFTGLLDKNGKECYEGDILTNSVAKWEVIFNTGCFCAKLIDKKAAASEVHLALRGVKNFEIIGNIYENPELLNL